jgi:transcriptional regulator with XRE-family HTH domain
MRRIGAEGTTMPDGAAARRGRGAAQDADRHVGTRIRERRTMLGLTQQQVAERIGVTYQQAHKYEIGDNRVSAGRLYQIAQALGVEPGYFFEGLGAERPAEPSRRMTIELARDFVALPSRRHQEALCGLARALNEG